MPMGIQGKVILGLQGKINVGLENNPIAQYHEIGEGRLNEECLGWTMDLCTLMVTFMYLSFLIPKRIFGRNVRILFG